jgi:arabinogalactan oligomer/maltooligosaccharide transport system permease protein
MRSFGATGRKAGEERSRPLTRGEVIEDVLVHAGLLFVAFIVLFPILWIFSMALDPRNISRPTSLDLIPGGASLRAFDRVLTEPLANNVMFSTMLKNSLIVSVGVALSVVVLAVSAAYAFSRFHFPGRTWGLFMFIAVLMLPQVATLAPLFVLLSRIKPFGMDESIRTTLAGVGVAYISGALPFAIWNLRGYIDTIPREVEEAAFIDGAGPNRAFIDVVFPLILPAISITGPVRLHGGLDRVHPGLDLPDRPQPLHPRDGAELDGRPVLFEHAVVGVRRDGDPDHPADRGPVLPAPALDRLRPRRRRGQGVGGERRVRAREELESSLPYRKVELRTGVSCHSERYWSTSSRIPVTPTSRSPARAGRTVQVILASDSPDSEIRDRRDDLAEHHRSG